MQALLYPLALLACPVGMGLMMWMMMRGQRTDPGQDSEQRQVAELRAEVEALKADRGRLPAEWP